MEEGGGGGHRPPSGSTLDTRPKNHEARTCTQHDHPPPQTQPPQQTDAFKNYLITELTRTLKSLFPNGVDGPTLPTVNFSLLGLRGVLPSLERAGVDFP